MSKSTPSPKRSIADYAMKPPASPKASSSSIIRPSIGSTILPTQNRYTTLGTIPQSPRNYLEAATSSASPSSPQTPPLKPIYTQETGYVVKDIKIPISTVEDFQKAATPYETAQKILLQNWHFIPEDF